MTARRKKPVRARRVTAYRAWDADWAKLFDVPKTWTAPASIKLVHGKAAGTFSARFVTQRGEQILASCRFRLTKDGLIEILDQTFTQVFRWKAAAK